MKFFVVSCNEIGDALIKMVHLLENALLVFKAIRYSNDTCEDDLQNTRTGVIEQFLTEHLKRLVIESITCLEKIEI